MAYVTTNPPVVVMEGGIDNPSGAFWRYTSADVAATVAGSSYFTNGVALGMKLNDLVFVVDTATPLVTTHRVKTIGATAVTVSAGTTVGAT